MKQVSLAVPLCIRQSAPSCCCLGVMPTGAYRIAPQTSLPQVITNLLHRGTRSHIHICALCGFGRKTAHTRTSRWSSGQQRLAEQTPRSSEWQRIMSHSWISHLAAVA